MVRTYLCIKSFYWSIQSKKLNIFRTSAINTKSVYSFIQYQAQKNIIVYYLFHFPCSRCQSNGSALHIFAHATILQLLPKQHNGFLYYCWVSKYTALQEGLSTVIHSCSDIQTLLPFYESYIQDFQPISYQDQEGSKQPCRLYQPNKNPSDTRTE